MQQGFIIDHSRCIGCHACTVACKSENDVPLGSFRTWVKYTESGTFPQVKRSFAVLRCNQCSSAPCVTICPVRALEKRDDGIVDIDPAACIGCKACLQGCPYDAIYINADSGTAEKCHFCAHRTERGLAPACAIVCPTEAIIPGDFDDPASRVSQMRKEEKLSVRKPQAGTGPNVLYKDVNPESVDPTRTSAAGGFLWANQVDGEQLDADIFRSLEKRAKARTTYDVSHPRAWGGRVSAYLFTKALAAGVFPVAWWAGARSPEATLGAAGLALFFLLVTAILLVLDLKRPERFYFILLRPNFSSWLTRGTFVLAFHGLALATIAVTSLLGHEIIAVLAGFATATAFLTAAYTGWLFAQARGRVLWLQSGLWLHLSVKAAVAGAAVAISLAAFEDARTNAVLVFVVALVAHAAFLIAEGPRTPAGRGDEYRQTIRLLTHGPYRRRRWLVSLGLGVVVPLLLVLLTSNPILAALAGVVALIGLGNEDDLLVTAGQALPIS